MNSTVLGILLIVCTGLLICTLAWVRQTILHNIDQRLTDQQIAVSQLVNASLDPFKLQIEDRLYALGKDTIRVNDLLNFGLLIDRQGQRQEVLSIELAHIRRELAQQIDRQDQSQEAFSNELAHSRHELAQQQVRENTTATLLRQMQRDSLRVNDLANLVLLINKLSQRHDLVASEVAQIRDNLADQQRSGDMVSEAVARLERVLAGPSRRGRLGERMVEQQLQLLPGEWVARNVLFPDGRVVEFALRTPAGRLVPIDSKWTATELLDRYGQTEDEGEKRKIETEIQRVVIGRAVEVTKYLDEHRTIGFCIAAVPDPVFQFCHPIQPYLTRKNVVLISYSLLVPYLLALVNLLFSSAQAESVLQNAHTIKRTLLYIEEVQQHIDRQVRRTFDNVKHLQNQHINYNQRLDVILDKAHHIQLELDEIQQYMPESLKPLNVMELSSIPNTLQYQLAQIRESILRANHGEQDNRVASTIAASVNTLEH